ncbi:MULTISPECIES: hypothetical protein [unclassified Paenibacillus]|uniref:hypothetical protein n=1 Tax=unclassified Paenibacillus TaxID=185978 RepID=UPI002404B4A8|nr:MULTISPECIES: hypothetical protein [unclassified Paenibacillus]MDF9842006.1 hypothetical protein [Paenibacillus sp. PastF-2]MDF9848740.1 hypothetical protein [Paenibacillus sp. PastM-2]MDF9855310.1 hypothetical protein [Paenibacillus sp. PastF-1]MDH6480580.1 hypothetical protein [Paenibacillus sp. PastH-2]MDH6508006.1 hypothetical protein [Paenibacillus sp. PastM-3]
MKETVLRALFMWLVLFILLQPIFTYIDYLLDLQVKANTSYLTQKAATEGIVTSSMKNEVIANLKAVGFPEASIVISSNTEFVQERKQRLDVYIKAPRLNLFPYNFSSGSQPTHYYGHGSIMSEYLD